MWTLRRSAKPRPSADPVGPDDVAGLISELQALRLTMGTDLSLAAGALDADAPEVAAEVIEADRAELAAFRLRAEARLAALSALAAPAVPAPAGPPPLYRRVARSRLLPAAPVLAAAAVAVAISTGALPAPGHGGDGFRPQPAASSWQAFSRAASDRSSTAVLAAARQLHQSVESLIAEAPHNPTAGAQAMLLLQMERAILLQDQPPGTPQLLAQAQSLVERLTAALPHLPTTIDGVKQQTHRHASTPSPTATPAPYASPTRPAEPSPSPAAPSASPTPPSTIGPIPGTDSVAR